VKPGDRSSASPLGAAGLIDSPVPTEPADEAPESPSGRGATRTFPPLEPLPIGGLTRRHLGLVLAVVAVAWIVLVIVRAVADSSATSQQALLLRAEKAQLERRLDAARRELALVRSAPYVRLEARAYGMGAGDERAFALQPGAPPPPRITPLGADPREGRPTSPLEDWLELLFGR
jgi:hypothetical protein